MTYTYISRLNLNSSLTTNHASAAKYLESTIFYDVFTGRKAQFKISHGRLITY